MKVPEDQMKAARAELAEAWLRSNPGKSESDMPEALRESLQATETVRASEQEAAAFREQMFAEKAHKGLLVALWLTPGTAQELALSEGESAEDLHVTLCYGGDVSEMDDLDISRIVGRIDQAAGWRPPLEGKVSGYGRFNSSESSDGQDVFYASVDIPGLTAFRQDLMNMLSGGDINYPISQKHGFTPHITLAYVDPGGENPVDKVPGINLHFNKVTVVAGDKRIDIPFSGFQPSVYSTAAQDSEAPWRLFVEQAFSEPTVPATINVLPKPGSYSHPSYGQITITTERNQRFIKNFDDRVYQQDLPLTLDVEHDGKSAGAIGYFERLVMREDGSVDAEIKWTDRGKRLMEEDAFRYFSPEWWDTWRDPHSRQTYKDVLIGGAICTRPFFKESALRPLVASEAGLAAPSSSGDGVMVLQPMDVVRESTRMSEKDDTKPVAPAGTVTLSEDQYRQFQDMQRQVAAAETALQASEQARVAMEEQVKALTVSAQRQRFSDIVRGKGGDGDGAVFVGGIEENVDSLMALANAFGEDSDEFRKEVDLRKKTAAAFKEAKIFTPLGSDEKPKETAESDDEDGEKADAEARKKMSENPNLTYGEAVAMVFRENPNLYDGHRRAATKRPDEL